MDGVTYGVRVLGVEKRRNVQGVITSYRASWTVDGKRWHRSFATAALAGAFRSELMQAARHGEPFSVETGQPAAWARRDAGLSWFTFTLEYTEAKWPLVSPGHRRGIAEALTDATEAFLTRDQTLPREKLRRALRWAYSERIRDRVGPGDLAEAVRWLTASTVSMDSFRDRGTAATLARRALTRISQTKEGRLAAASTATRRRAILNGAFEYGRETGRLQENPLQFVRWVRPRSVATVDPEVVINPEQARRFLAAVEQHSDLGRRLKAFFGAMYYAGLRPEEVVELRRHHLGMLPHEPDVWGELRLTHAQPRSGSSWTNNGEVRERGPLKHRAVGESRPVPVHPELVRLLRIHLDRYVAGPPDSRLFVGVHGGPVTDRTYLRVFHAARRAAFTEVEAASSLMEVPYSLRHAAVSTWLRSGGDAAQVAEWAGHSVAVLLNVYAKCVHGAQTETLTRIYEATRTQSEPKGAGAPPPPDPTRAPFCATAES